MPLSCIVLSEVCAIEYILDLDRVSCTISLHSEPAASLIKEANCITDGLYRDTLCESLLETDEDYAVVSPRMALA